MTLIKTAEPRLPSREAVEKNIEHPVTAAPSFSPRDLHESQVEAILRTIRPAAIVLGIDAFDALETAHLLRLIRKVDRKWRIDLRYSHRDEKSSIRYSLIGSA